MAKNTTTNLAIAGVQVPVTIESVPLASLSLDTENPRVRLQLTFGGRKKPTTQAGMLELMREQNGYPELHKQIREDGGISDPLIVRHDGRIVEGNTRFAVVSTLAEKTNGGAAKWGMVPIIRLPKDVPEKSIQLLMASYHIAGKTNWRPSAQADQIYHLKKEGATVEEIVQSTRMNRSKVEHYIDAYEFLLKEVLPEHKGATAAERKEILESRFSHALQLVSVRALKPVREDKATRKWVAKQIAHNKLTGHQVRNLNPVIAHPQARAALEKEGFKAAKEVLRVVDPAHEARVIKMISKLTLELNDLDQKDLKLFKEHAPSREALEGLGNAVQTVLQLTKRESKRRA